MLVIPCFLLVLSALPATAVPNEHKRDIFGLLGGDSDTSSASHPTRPILTTHRASTTSSSANPSLSTFQSSAEQWTPTPTPPTDPAEPTVVKTALASAPSIQPASAESHATDHSSKTWQIIGIAIIAVLFLATSIACAMFFDRLWRFLKDVICCTSRPLVSEEFIPDCEKQTWDTSTLSPSPSNLDHYKAESLREDASVYTIRARELPWNTNTQDWSTLHRQPSRRNDRPPAA
ncbi:hypothetical protein J3R83DRAFT_6324 [Lanmaoa asiatica]|nr:hypothetical protein J3R83DRAFT_6324 [Lanmaoa asiatica]